METHVARKRLGTGCSHIVLPPTRPHIPLTTGDRTAAPASGNPCEPQKNSFNSNIPTLSGYRYSGLGRTRWGWALQETKLQSRTSYSKV